MHTPNSFIHFLYNSLYMDIVNMHNVMITPSDSVLWEKTMEASYLVGSFPCQLSQISLTDIPVWDGVWEEATFRHLYTLWQAAHSDSSVSTGCSCKNPSLKDSSSSPLPSQQIGVRSSKTSQCGSANRPSVVPQGSPRIWCLSKSLLVSQIAVSVCRHNLPPCTTKWVTLL